MSSDACNGVPASEWLHGQLTEILGTYPDLGAGGALPEEAGLEQAREIMTRLAEVFPRREDEDTGEVSYGFDPNSETELQETGVESQVFIQAQTSSARSLLLDLRPPDDVSEDSHQLHLLYELAHQDLQTIDRESRAGRPFLIDVALPQLLDRCDRFLDLSNYEAPEILETIPGADARLRKARALNQVLCCLYAGWLKERERDLDPTRITRRCVTYLRCAVTVIREIHAVVREYGWEECLLLEEVDFPVGRVMLCEGLDEHGDRATRPIGMLLQGVATLSRRILTVTSARGYVGLCSMRKDLCGLSDIVEGIVPDDLSDRVLKARKQGRVEVDPRPGVPLLSRSEVLFFQAERLRGYFNAARALVEREGDFDHDQAAQEAS